jgi:hypothetical protein
MDTFEAIMEYRNKVYRWRRDKAKMIEDSKEHIRVASAELVEISNKLGDLDLLLSSIDKERWIKERRSG